MRNQAIIHATLAAGSVATAPYYDINISQKLCTNACDDDGPSFSPAFSVLSIESVGTNQYLINIHVEGAVIYVPCGGCCCQTRTQLVSQDFSVPVYSATEVAGATITAGTSKNEIQTDSCKNCSNVFVSDTPITISLS